MLCVMLYHRVLCYIFTIFFHSVLLYYFEQAYFNSKFLTYRIIQYELPQFPFMLCFRNIFRERAADASLLTSSCVANSCPAVVCYNANIFST